MLENAFEHTFNIPRLARLLLPLLRPRILNGILRQVEHSDVLHTLQAFRCVPFDLRFS